MTISTKNKLAKNKKDYKINTHFLRIHAKSPRTIFSGH